MTEEKREVDLRNIVFDYVKEYEPDVNMNESVTLAEAMEVHEDLFRTHYKFTDRDFDMMILDLIDYIEADKGRQGGDYVA